MKNMTRRLTPWCPPPPEVALSDFRPGGYHYHEFFGGCYPCVFVGIISVRGLGEPRQGSFVVERRGFAEERCGQTHRGRRLPPWGSQPRTLVGLLAVRARLLACPPPPPSLSRSCHDLGNMPCITRELDFDPPIAIHYVPPCLDAKIGSIVGGLPDSACEPQRRICSTQLHGIVTSCAAQHSCGIVR